MGRRRALEVTLLLVLALTTQASAGPKVDVAQMHEYYWVLTDARDHVIEGDLAAAKSSATELQAQAAEAKRPKKKYRGFTDALAAAVQSVANAESLDAASVGVAKAAVACGACHEASDGGPDLAGAANVPPQAWQEGQNMALHRWAMDWMWLGLIDHNADAWKRGASELGNKPLLFKFPADEGDDGSQWTKLEQQVYDLADYAQTTEADRRGEAFGVLIGTCASCHTMVAEAKAAAEAAADEEPAEEPTE